MRSPPVVLITGAAGNLGSAATAAFRALGARTVLVERSQAKLLRSYGDTAQQQADVLLIGDVELTDEASWHLIVTRATARFGRLDALVNTAGAYRAGRSLVDADLSDWQTMLDANLLTALVACRAVLPGMLAQQHGRIVNVASRDALAGTAGAAAYAASKAALLRMTESLAAETRGRGVTANCVLPGPIDTPQNRAALSAGARASLTEPAAIADVIVFLASEAARAVSGTALPVGGAG